MDNQASAQAEDGSQEFPLVTEQTSEEEGQSVPIVESRQSDTIKEQHVEAAEEKKEEDNEQYKEKRIEEKKYTISQEEWQQMVEKSKDFEQLKENLAKALGVSEEEAEETDLMKKMQEQIDSLKEESKRKDWEIDHPIVRKEKYMEAWKKVNKDPKYASLSYDERWKLIKEEEDPTGTSRDLQDQEANFGSIPPVSKSTTKSSDDIEPWVMDQLRSTFPSFSDEEIRKLSK